jgi:hypothetical protein
MVDIHQNIKQIKLAEIVIEWNTTKGYTDKPSGDGKKGNCQEFVDAVLKKLNIKTNFDGPLGKRFMCLIIKKRDI